MRLIAVLVTLFSLSVFAEDSKKIEVDLDVSATVVVFADLDQQSIEYFIDKTACVCTLYFQQGPMPVSCKKLSAHKKLAPHVAHCKN